MRCRIWPMGRFLRHLLNSAASAIGDSMSSREYQLNRRGFSADADHLRGDFAAVGRDLRKTLKREQQTNNRTR